MAEATYPLMRRRRRRMRRRIAWPRRRTAMLMIGILGFLALMITVVALRPRDRRDPTSALADASAALARGNYSAARNDAMAAINTDPGSVAAHLMLGRAYLSLGDGLAAEAELDRAVDHGATVSDLHGERARALFEQGELDGALAETAAAPVGDGIALRTRARVLAAQGARGEAERLLSAQVAARPHDAAALVDLARILLDAGDVGGAAAAAARAARLAPRDPMALALQGEVVRTRYGPVAALPWFAAALKSDAYYHPALIEYAATLGDLGRYSEMLGATRKALAAQPGSPQALYLQATLAARAGHPTLARSLLDRAGPIDRRIAGAMLLSGGIDYRDGRFEQTIGDWRRLVDVQPMNLAARRLLAAALLGSGDAQGARGILAPMLARGDADTYALTLAGRASERLGDRATAGRLLDRAGMGGREAAGIFDSDGTAASAAENAALAPDDPALAIAVVRARVEAGDAAGAIGAARDLVARTPGDPAMQRALGDALTADGRTGEAIEAYTRAADLAFDEPTMLRLVDALGRTGHTREASATLALYLQQNPQSIVGQRLRAHWLVAGGAGARAIETLEALRGMVGNRNTGLLTDLALAYVAAKDPAVALRYARAAYAIAPLDPAVVDAYGLALAADQQVDGARQMFAKAMLLDPGNATILAHARQASR